MTRAEMREVLFGRAERLPRAVLPPGARGRIVAHPNEIEATQSQQRQPLAIEIATPFCERGRLAQVRFGLCKSAGAALQVPQHAQRIGLGFREAGRPRRLQRQGCALQASGQSLPLHCVQSLPLHCVQGKL